MLFQHLVYKLFEATYLLIKVLLLPFFAGAFWRNELVSICCWCNLKVSDLTVELQKMRSQYDQVQKRLKEETDKKCVMEKGMIANTHKVKELETKLDQQQKILKRKNEEVSSPYIARIADLFYLQKKNAKNLHFLNQCLTLEQFVLGDRYNSAQRS